MKEMKEGKEEGKKNDESLRIFLLECSTSESPLYAYHMKVVSRRGVQKRGGGEANKEKAVTGFDEAWDVAGNPQASLGIMGTSWASGGHLGVSSNMA